ncbi:MAG: hypothetical protein ACREMY_08235, partial [bacterium]
KTLSSYLGQACGDITARGGTRLVDCLVSKGMKGLGDDDVPPPPISSIIPTFKPLPASIYQTPPVLPLATADTIRAAAALPNAPLIVRQTAASLPPASSVGSIFNIFGKEAIPGTGLSYGMLAGAGLFLVMITVMKKR